MTRAHQIRRDIEQEYRDDSNLINLLLTYGNRIFDPHPSKTSDIVLAARFFRDCDLAGPIIDIGAGEGMAALILGCLVDRPVIAVELIAARAARIRERAARFALSNVIVRNEDAFALDLREAAALYIYTPFFDADSQRFVGKIVAECRPGTRVFALGMFAKFARAGASLHEIGKRRGAFGRAELVVV